MLSVGLVGAGPWARYVHGPVLAAGPETRLAGIWARRPEAAAALASRLDVPAFDRYEALLEASEAVSFAVPPDVQATMAIDAARAGRAVLLEKPVAAGLDGARRLAEAVGEAGVVSQLVLSWRYAAGVRDFLSQAAELAPIGGRAAFVSGGLLDGPFAHGWRLERGSLLDLGPHVIDLLDAALGRVVGIRAHGSSRGWIGLLLEHESGAVSEASLCADVAAQPHRSDAAVYGASGFAEVDCAAATDGAAFATMRAEFAAAVALGASPPLDVRHGLRLQALIAQAEAQVTE
jgi:predicted dehydrogenase